MKDDPEVKGFAQSLAWALQDARWEDFIPQYLAHVPIITPQPKGFSKQYFDPPFRTYDFIGAAVFETGVTIAIPQGQGVEAGRSLLESLGKLQLDVRTISNHWRPT